MDSIDLDGFDDDVPRFDTEASHHDTLGDPSKSSDPFQFRRGAEVKETRKDG